VIIDCHCHAGEGDRMTVPWNTNAPIKPYLRRARAAGIDKTIVCAAFNSDYFKANTRVARIIAQHPDRLVGFAFVHATRDAGRIRSMLECAVRNWGFRGIKVHGHEAMPTREVCDAARRLKLPMLVDVTSRAEVIDMLAPEYQDVNFIVAHLGSNTDNFRAHQQVVDQIARYSNVYTETSGVRLYDYVVRAVRKAGCRKILFGSDGPWSHPGVEIQKIRLLGLSREDEALILGGNILRLLRRQSAPDNAASGGNPGRGISPQVADLREFPTIAARDVTPSLAKNLRK